MAESCCGDREHCACARSGWSYILLDGISENEKYGRGRLRGRHSGTTD